MQCFNAEKIWKNCCWLLENEENIKSWEDPWVPIIQHKIPEKATSVSSEIQLVKDLIVQNENRWDDVKLQQLFNPVEIRKIADINLVSNNENKEVDKMTRMPHPKRNFSAKSFLKTLADSQPSSSYVSEAPWKNFGRLKICILRFRFLCKEWWRMVLQ